MTEFVWDGSHLVQEINRENDRTFSYIYRSPQSYEPLAQVCTDNKQNHTQTRDFHCDQIGVPQELTDENDNLCWYGDYLGWGKLRNSHNLMADAHQPFRLQNQYADEETGLHYNFLRYYEPALGRFITQDPIGLMGGMNVYQFANNTQAWVDPLGLAHFCTRHLKNFPFSTDLDKDFRGGLDLGLFHEHIFFDDGTNIGYTTTGTFSEQSSKGYKCGNEHFDDKTMKEAVKNVKNRKIKKHTIKKGQIKEKHILEFGDKEYNVLLNNCQDFVTEVEKEYYRLGKK